MTRVVVDRQRERLRRQERPVGDFLPFGAPLDAHTVVTQGGDIMQVIRVRGLGASVASPEDLDARKGALNAVLRNVADSRVALWAHVIRRPAGDYPAGDYAAGSYAAALNDRWRARLAQRALRDNTLYLTVIYRPGGGRKVRNAGVADADLEALHEIVQNLVAGLGRFGARRLGVYKHEGQIYSEIVEFFSFLVNLSWQRRLLTRHVLGEVLPFARPFFSPDSIEMHVPGADPVYGEILGVGEYGETSWAGAMDGLLSAPFDFILTQGFVFVSKPVAVERLTRQQRRMRQTEDHGISQVEAITDALDDLVSGRLAFGEHHLSLLVMAESRARLKRMTAEARSILADTGMVVARETLGNMAAFYAQCPGNFRLRTRPSLITSWNFAAFASWHNHVSGRRRAQWGPAATLFESAGSGPYYFNFHDGEGGQALGHTVVIGPSGSGKTVFQGFVVAQSRKYRPTQVIVDKDRGLEIFCRASGGDYRSLAVGQPTGFNPFGMAATAGNIQFLESLVRSLALGRDPSPGDEEEVAQAVRGVMGMDPEVRRLGLILEYLDPTRTDGPAARLARWCGQGPLAWVFDHTGPAGLAIGDGSITGVDVTEFLDVPEIRTPIVAYLFHRIEAALTGHPVMIVLDEFWKLLDDPFFADFARNKLKVFRKQNGILILGTQSARDVIASSIGHSVIEQCATQVFFPNPQAARADHVEGFGLTEKEFLLVREELPARQCLVRQPMGSGSAVLKFDMAGMDDDLAVISGTTAAVGVLESVLAEMPDAPPAEWLPVFHARRRET